MGTGNRKKTVIILSICLTALLSCSKGNTGRESQIPVLLNETADTVSYSDYSGKTVTVKKHPKRVVVLFNSFLDLWYFAGGKAVARVKGEINVPPAAEKVEIVGTLGNPNLEKIVSLKPDLVIVNREMKNQRKINSFLTSGDIPFIEISYINYNDFLFISDLFCRINGSVQGLKKIEKIKSDINGIVSKCPDKGNPLVMITFASANSITAELPGGDTGTILKMLKAKNIATSSPVKNGSRIDMSIEKITAMNPDIMLVKMMGTQDAVQARLKDYFKSNSSLKEIRAVKNDRVYYLPRELFMYKPNEKYPEAFEYLAKILYPVTFK